MENKDRTKPDPLEAHSLPGTNQAGRKADSCDEAEQESTPDEGRPKATDAPKSRRENVR